MNGWAMVFTRHFSLYSFSLKKKRITDIKKLQATFEKCLKAVREEGSLMMRTLQRAEHAQDDLHHILDIVRGCLTLRNEKQSKELVNDEPHREIQQVITFKHLVGTAR